jgi:hypothetical protein
MGVAMQAIETTGRINAAQQLVLDQPLPITRTGHVRVIILLSTDDESDETDEALWLRAAATNATFDFLKDPAENIYTLADGEPFDAEA